MRSMSSGILAHRPVDLSIDDSFSNSVTMNGFHGILLYFFSLLLFKLTLCLELDVRSELVRENAAFALSELKLLSDSKIYDTLDLNSIISASTKDGIYHDNIILKVELSSPYFKSGKQIELFEFIVMTHKADKMKTIAIDEFPVMLEDAIEEFTIRKIEEKRRRRQETLREMELSSIMTEQEELSQFDLSHIQERMSEEDVRNMFANVETNETLSYRKMLSASLIPNLPTSRISEEEALMNYSLFEIYQISRSIMPSSEYQNHRCKQILRAVLGHLKKRERARQFDELKTRTWEFKDEL